MPLSVIQFSVALQRLAGTNYEVFRMLQQIEAHEAAQAKKPGGAS